MPLTTEARFGQRSVLSLFLPVLVTLTGFIGWTGHLCAQSAGSLDTSFSPRVGLLQQDSVYATAQQPDGKILAGGTFTIIGSSTCSYLGRLNLDGGLDATFNPGTGPDGAVNCIAIQADGKILIGGKFNFVNGQSRNRIARLNPDGSVEDSSTFTATAGGDVNSIAVQPNGQILVAGSFTSFNDPIHRYLVRLNPDGSLESTTTFNTGVSANNTVNSVALQTDGKILLGGSFTTFNSHPAGGILRLNSDGSVEDTSTFNAGTGTNGTVNGVALQGDGKILLSGTFGTVNGAAHLYIARLGANGAVESSTTFKNTGSTINAYTTNFVPQANGKLILGGDFTTIGSGSRPHIARLNADGTSDTNFNFFTSSADFDLYPAMQGDGKILLGGGTTFVNGTPSHLVREFNDTAVQTLTVPDTTQVQWQRGGGAPETQQVNFSVSTDGGGTWSNLGNGARVAGGWQLTGLSLPPSGFIRARAVLCGGKFNGSSGIMEQLQAYGGQSSAPLANTLPVSNLTVNGIIGNFGNSAGATLNATVNTLGNTTVVTFEYGTTTSYGSSVLVTQNLNGSNTSAVSATLTNLPLGTTMHCRVTATSSAGTTHGNDVTFFTLNNDDTLKTLSVSGATLNPPFSLSGPVNFFDSVLPSSATTATINFILDDPNAVITVNGTVVPPGTTSITLPIQPGPNSIPVKVTATDGVDSNTYNLNVTRTTLPVVAPTHCDVAATTTCMNVLITPNAVSASVSFEYGLDTSYGTTVAGANVSGGLSLKTGATVTGLTPGTTYHYRVTCVNSEGSVTSGDSTFTTYVTPPAGRIDSTLTTNVSGFVFASAPQPHGKNIIGGFFQTVNSVASGNLARLNANGTLDHSFTATTNDEVLCMAVQADGKILIGGYFTLVDGVTRNRVARLNPDGSLDTAFNPNANNQVTSIAIQADGQILLGGFFTKLGSVTQNYVARLASNGTLDTTFNPNPDIWVNSVAVQADGGIVLGGWFNNVGGVAHAKIARLFSNGAVDPTVSATLDSPVNSVALQADGSILMGGFFSKVNSISHKNIARLNADGSLDATFDPGASDQVLAISVQTDDKIILGGLFRTLGGVSRNYIGRINPDGSLDPVFDPDASSSVQSLMIQTDGSLLVGGNGAIFGTRVQGIARLLNDASQHTLTVPDVTQVQWHRSGSGPELTSVSFEVSIDGGNSWSMQGYGSRVSGGWLLQGLTLPPNAALRARGRVSGCQGDAGSGIIEDDVTYHLAPYLPVEAWRMQYYGGTANSGNAADMATPDQDGICNLLKYALLIAPGTSGAAQLPQVQTTSFFSGTSPNLVFHNCLSLQFTRDINRTDITLNAEAADNPAGPWTVIASSIGGAAFTGSSTVSETDLGNGLKSVTVPDIVDIQDAPRRFMRLTVVH